MEKARDTSKISDQDLQEAVGDTIDLVDGVETFNPNRENKSKTIDHLAINRRRVIWLNHEAVTQARRAREELKAKQTAAKEQKKKTRTILANMKTKPTEAIAKRHPAPPSGGVSQKKRASPPVKAKASACASAAPELMKLSTGRQVKSTLSRGDFLFT